MDRLHLIIRIISVLMIIWFMIPVLAHKILNIGNATGMVVFLLILLIDVFNKPLAKFVAFVCKSVWGKVIAGAVLLIIATIFVTAFVETILIIGANFDKPLKPTTIVVLGCTVYGDNPSKVLKRRIDTTYEYLVNNEDAVAILSGGKEENGNIAEAECMYRCLTSMGIDEKRLYKEDKSVSTKENLIFSMDIVKRYGLSSDISLLTSNFHGYRAKMIAKRLGLDVKVITCTSPWYSYPTYHVRELYGILHVLFWGN